MLRPWKLKIDIQRNAGMAIYLQIAQCIIEEIQRGRLLSGTALPGTRELAENLGINRKTVMLAYDELVAQGWLSAEGKRGTFVSSAIPALNNKAFPASDSLAARSHAPRYTFYGGAMPASMLQARDMLDFGDGVPDTRLIPYEIISRAFRHALIVSARANRLGYDDPRGTLALREAIVSMVNMERGLNAGLQNVCSVRGSQMGIFLAARLLVRQGDVVVMEELSYPPAREAFRACGAEVLSVGQDAQGLQVDELEGICRRQRIRAVYVTPHHQFPTTVVMSADRRLKLLMLAEQYNFAIIEDDYDHEFHFSHHPVMPLASLDRWGRVIYVGSLSKVLAPGLRVGYLIAPEKIIDCCASEIMLIDRQGNAVVELAAAELLNSGEVRRHVRRTLKTYSERRAVASALVTKELGQAVRFDLPDGGLALWLRLDERYNIDRLVRDAASLGVRILSSAEFSDAARPTPAIRLGYGNLNQDELAVGIQRLSRALQMQRPS
ncbi:MAG: PLP-dependent aminotransferase family protein [Methylobacillus sp.]|jgi:GntR family transcriptional regulator/MocR family aminotransferase|nr:PLP-dependent aminotransferase family protein [Methylobacillus sp.]